MTSRKTDRESLPDTANCIVRYQKMSTGVLFSWAKEMVRTREASVGTGGSMSFLDLDRLHYCYPNCIQLNSRRPRHDPGSVVRRTVGMKRGNLQPMVFDQSRSLINYSRSRWTRRIVVVGVHEVCWRWETFCALQELPVHAARVLKSSWLHNLYESIEDPKYLLISLTFFDTRKSMVRLTVALLAWTLTLLMWSSSTTRYYYLQKKKRTISLFMVTSLMSWKQ